MFIIALFLNLSISGQVASMDRLSWYNYAWNFLIEIDVLEIDKNIKNTLTYDLALWVFSSQIFTSFSCKFMRILADLHFFLHIFLFFCLQICVSFSQMFFFPLKFVSSFSQICNFFLPILFFFCCGPDTLTYSCTLFSVFEINFSVLSGVCFKMLFGVTALACDTTINDTKIKKKS